MRGSCRTLIGLEASGNPFALSTTEMGVASLFGCC